MINILLIFLNLALAQTNLVERVVDTQSKDGNPVSARTEMMTQATEKVSEQVIKENASAAQQLKALTIL